MIRDWGTYRGRAVEPLVREALKRLSTRPDRAVVLGGARHVGSYWTRNHQIEVDLVGGDAPEPTTIGFVGSIRWHDREPFSSGEAGGLAWQRAQVPGAAGAKLVAVSRTGAVRGAAVDSVFGPSDLLAAWP